ncbi:MAG: hypothetical protein AAFN77_11415 [Planctomycetota bacterium]
MTRFQFKRQFDTPLYWCLYVFTALIAFGFLAASLERPYFAVLGILFATITGFGLYSICKGDAAGITVFGMTLTYWVNGVSDARFTIDLADLSGIRYKRFDDDVIYLDLRDGRTEKIDGRYFGDICEVVSAICSERNDINPVCIAGPKCG